jgi:hypothetical protein
MRHPLRSLFLASLLSLCFVATPIAARPAEPPLAKADATTKVELTAAEKRLVADVAGGEFRTVSLAEAALIGSGVTDAAERKTYLTTIDGLEQEAREAVAEAKTPSDTGEKLLAFLHAPGGPMRKYVADQTSLAVLLDTGEFNCVSSAMLYNVLAGRLGLEVRAVELLDHSHVFSLLRDGERSLDVETTNPRGFNPKRKKSHPAAKAKNRREIGSVGLVAIVFANRYGLLGEEAQHREAVRAGLCAMALDRGLKGAEVNFRLALSEWCRALAADGKIKDALAVLEANGETLEAGARREQVKGIYQSRLTVLLKQGENEDVARMYAEAARRHKGDEQLFDHCQHQARACFDEWARPHRKGGNGPQRWRFTSGRR